MDRGQMAEIFLWASMAIIGLVLIFALIPMFWSLTSIGNTTPTAIATQKLLPFVFMIMGVFGIFFLMFPRG